MAGSLSLRLATSPTISTRIPRSYAKGFAATSEKVCVAVCYKMLTACLKSHVYPHSRIILRETLMNEQRKHAIHFAARIFSARKFIDADPDIPNFAPSISWIQRSSTRVVRQIVTPGIKRISFHLM